MLPDDLRSYLASAQLEWQLSGGEIRELTLYSESELQQKTFDVYSYELFIKGTLQTDPDETREYIGFDLVKTCKNYSPEGVLVWFPTLNEYGAWDCDHHAIITYPDVTWSQIAADPTWYVNGQWYPEKVRHRKLNPWAGGT